MANRDLVKSLKETPSHHTIGSTYGAMEKMFGNNSYPNSETVAFVFVLKEPNGTERLWEKFVATGTRSVMAVVREVYEEATKIYGPDSPGSCGACTTQFLSEEERAKIVNPGDLKPSSAAYRQSVAAVDDFKNMTTTPTDGKKPRVM